MLIVIAKEKIKPKGGENVSHEYCKLQIRQAEAYSSEGRTGGRSGGEWGGGGHHAESCKNSYCKSPR